jgi:hypothetical protein
MFADTGGIGVEALDHQVEGRRSNHIEVPINARRAPHFVGCSVKIGQTDIFRHTDSPFPE